MHLINLSLMVRTKKNYQKSDILFRENNDKVQQYLITIFWMKKKVYKMNRSKIKKFSNLFFFKTKENHYYR